MSLLLFIAGCQSPEIHAVRRTRILMDTIVTISVYFASQAGEAKAAAAIDSAFAVMAHIDSSMSSYRKESEVARLNRSISGARPAQPEGKSLETHGRPLPVWKYAPVAISTDLNAVLRTAVCVSEITDGAFDPTIAPLLQLWGFGTDSVGLPLRKRITARLQLVNWRALHLAPSDSLANSATNGRPAHNTISFEQPNMALDLGGIAKGYAVDLALNKLTALGFQDAMVEAGGDLRAAASPLTEGQRTIWVRHPRKAEQFFARFAMSSGAVATSGDYERFFEHEGRRYHHILNPRTGYPAGTLKGETQTVGATVTAPTSMLADAFATAVFVLGPERGIALANRLDEIEALIIFWNDGKLTWRASNEFMNKLTILSDEENE